MNPAVAQSVRRAELGDCFGVGEPSSLALSGSSSSEASERIVAVNRLYWPDEAPTSQLLTDSAEHLVRTGHAVTIVTSGFGYRDTGPRLPRHVVDFLEASGMGLALDCVAPETWAARLAPALTERSWVERRGAAGRQSFEATYTAKAALTRRSKVLETKADADAFATAREAA